MTKNFEKAERGFSLIELSIAIMFLGLMVSAALYGYKATVEKKRATATTEAMDTVVDAMAKYLSLHGHLPCPASSTAGPETNAYGRATDCADATQAVGSCANGICISQENGRRIRIGAVPFRDMNIGREDVIDAYKNRFTYALTEVQGTGAYVGNVASVRLRTINESGGTTDVFKDFVLVSHGRDGAGATTSEGTSLACGAGNEAENCNNDGIFVSAPYSVVDGAGRFDDMIISDIWDKVYLWDESVADSKSIYNRNTGSMGIGTDTPVEKLHVAQGNILIDGNFASAQLCNGNAGSCWPASRLGGSGMTCGANEFMSGIANGQPICSSIFGRDVNKNCPGDQYGQRLTMDSSTGAIVLTCAGIDPVAPPVTCPVPAAFGGGTRSVGQKIGMAYKPDPIVDPVADCAGVMRTCQGDGTFDYPSHTQTAASGSCAPAPTCVPPWGGAAIAGPITAYKAPVRSQGFAGNNLVENYGAGTCNGTTCTGSSCDEGCGNGLCHTEPSPVPQGTIVTWNSCALTCEAPITRYCQADGSWNGSNEYAYQSCGGVPPGEIVTDPPEDCTTPWGVLLTEGQSVLAHKVVPVYGFVEDYNDYTCESPYNETGGSCSSAADVGNKTVYEAFYDGECAGYSYGYGWDYGYESLAGFRYQTCQQSGERCESTTLTCTGGVLEGDTTFNLEGDCPKCALPWGGDINDGMEVIAYKSTSNVMPDGSHTCPPQMRQCSLGTLSGDSSYDQQIPPATCGCKPRYRWVTVGSSGTISHAAGCAAVGATAVTASPTGICAAGERRPVSGYNWQAINYNPPHGRGTWGGASRGGDVVPFQNNAYRCYHHGSKWDKDNTDVAIAYYCDFISSGEEDICPDTGIGVSTPTVPITGGGDDGPAVFEAE